MSKKREKYTEEERAEIVCENERNHASHVYKRLLALKLKAIEGMRSEDAARISGLSQAGVNQIVRRYKEQGMEAIIGRRHNHGKRYMTYEQEVAFLAQFREAGEAGRVIEVTDIYQAYQKAVGHPVTRNAIYYLLKKHGWRKIMPRGQHPKKASDEAIQAYKKNHEHDPGTENYPAETARDVSGRGWIWADQ